MNTNGNSAAFAAIMRTIAEKRKTDPLIGAKLGAKEVFARLLDGLKDEKGVQIESLLCVLGALAGFACQASVRAKSPGGAGLITATGADGNRYYFGDAINGPLLEDKLSVWSIAAGAAHDAGAKTLPDPEEIIRYVVDTVGTSQFGVPRSPGTNQPSGFSVRSVTSMWPAHLPLLRQFTIDSKEWPLLFALSIREAILAGKNAIEPAVALKLAMEVAVSASKLDMSASLAKQTGQSKPPVQPTPPLKSGVVASASARPQPNSRETSRTYADRKRQAEDAVSKGPYKHYVTAAVVVIGLLFGYAKHRKQESAQTLQRMEQEARETRAREIQAALAAGKKESKRTAALPHQDCRFLKYNSPLPTAPPMPASASKFDLEARGRAVLNARSAESFQDAVFAIHHFNRRNGTKSSTVPDVEPVEVFGSSFDVADYKEKLCRSSAVMTVTAYVGEAAHNYPNAMSFPDAVMKMKREHPGFSENTYAIVQSDSMTAMR